MAPAGGSQRWYFSDDLLANSPSRKSGVSPDKEESYRQQAANFIQDMGQRLQVTQLCINTAIVYMQRFYMFHSFARFHRNHIAAAALFLAAKVEEQPRKLEHVIKVSHVCLNRSEPQLETKSEKFLEQAQELHANENILLQTLGFDVAIDHPHTHVVKCCQMVKAHKELAQTSYFMATNSLHLTTMCLRYSPTIVACVCIHLACKWSQYQIPVSLEGRPWYSYVDQDANIDQIERLTSEFLAIFDKCPSRLKKKILQSHNDTKDQEERRKRENMQSDQYRIDFGNGDVANVSMNTQHALQGGNPLQGGGSGSGSSGLGSGSSSNSGGQSSNSGQPPPSKQPKYPPGHAPTSRSSSKPPVPAHGHPPGNKPTLQQHLHGGHKSSSVPGHPPGYRQGGGSSSVRGLGDKSGQRPEASHHQRSQSHGGQPLSEEQLRQQQRERHREQQYKQQQQQKLQQQQQQQQQQHGAMSGYPPGYGRSSSSSSLPPPYPGAGQQMPNKHTSSSASQHQSKSMPRSIFDLSPEKTARPEKPPLGPIADPPMPFHESLLPTAPNYPQPGLHPSAPPSYSAPGPMSSYSSLPPYPKPSEPSFQLPQVAQVPQSLSPIRDIPSLSLSTRHQPPMDPSSMDTPTPTNIANMFSYPGSSKQPGSSYPMSTQAQMPNKTQQQRHDRSLQNLMGDISHSQTSSDTKSKNLNMLFDDFDDFPVPQGLPQAPTIPSKVPSMSNQKQSKQHPVSDFSDLFGDDGDPSSLLGNLTQSSAASNLSTSFGGYPSSGLKPDLSSVKTEPPSLASHSGVLSMSASVKTEYPEYKVKKEETDTKRRNSDKLQSEEKKPRISKTGGLFSPSPTDGKPNLSSLKSPIKSEQDHKRSRTTSSSKDPDAVVSVQKLENLAPEFQAFRGSNAPASIILGPNDRPSPSKKKEGDPSPKKEKQESSQDKRRSGSGASREKKSSPEAGASNTSPKSEEKNRDHKKKKEKKEKKDKKDKKDKREKEGESKKDDDKDKKHKKDKKKSKDKDKEKERDKDKNKTPSVKIKMDSDSGQEGGSGMPAIPKITLKLGGGITRITGGGGDTGDTDSGSKKDKDSRKRERSASSAKLDKFEVPAAKMARATGADPSRESKFLEESFKKKGHR